MRWSTIAVAALATVAQAHPGHHHPSGPPKGPACDWTDFWKLGNQLSKDAEIYLPESTEWTSVSQRWSNVGTPTVNITILPANENDVVEIVKMAQRCDIPFLAYNGVHGAITTLKDMTWGIAINIRKLSSVNIAPNGQTVTIGGGTNSKVVIDTLWAAGKQTVTGTCECVSYMGPALGGGHGWLQGHHGLISDQWTSLRIVLADGSVKTVSPTGPHSDLWWAMRGAGHNFGIVTQVTAKIYPIQHTNWAIQTLMFTGDKVQQLYQTANDVFLPTNGSAQPVDIINWSYWMNVPPVDPTGPVMEFYIIQEGVTAVDPAYVAPFEALGPVASTPNTGTYRDVSAWVGINMDGPPCQKTGAANPRFPVYLERYNVTAQQQVYDAFKAITNSSGPFANSLFLFEGYSMQGVHAQNASGSAFAWREDNLLTAPLITYMPDPANPVLHEQARLAGDQLRQILKGGSGRSELHAYVNYAYGDEQVGDWYGHDSWRLTRLANLKNKYDPEGRFSFYAPAA
ncbi:hypothetical protein QBC38DRAFT_469282 [Podospora fimiseda]|uniref:FAD-binding PCMH-type domain-containing protein n=1 Tax=Podospora fimiseda TaxID=252190 RepID=A0AAN7H401_9PEZI|nr:hypothetical protein QBC38DRAFT_469282 [Podospora fimiseda]